MARYGASGRVHRLLKFAALLLAALFVLSTPKAEAKPSNARVGTLPASEFGASGPGRLAAHEATRTLYAIDFSHSPKRVLKIDASDPADLKVVPFSSTVPALTAGEGGATLDLRNISRLYVDNSGGPQDGTIYVLQGSNLAPKIDAFSPSGAHLYRLKDNGADWAQPITAIAPDGTLITGSSAAAGVAFLPSTTPGQPPTKDVRSGFLIDGGMGFVLPGEEKIAFFQIKSEWDWPTPTHQFVAGFLRLDNFLPTGDAELKINPFGQPAIDAITPAAEPWFWFARTATNGVTKYRITETEIEQADRFGQGLALPGAGMVAVGSDLFLSVTGTDGGIYAFGQVEAPEPEALPAESTSPTSAKLKGRVVTAGVDVTSCRFEISTSQNFTPSQSLDCDPDEIDGSEGSADVEGVTEVTVTPSTRYYIRINATGGNGSAASSDAIEWFAPDVPEAETLPAGPQDAEVGTAYLGGTVNAKGSPTQFYIEYGTDPALSDPEIYPAARDGDAGSAQAAKKVGLSVPGLTPATLYYYRMVAYTPAGEDKGAIMSFTTLAKPQAQPTSCTNDPIREGKGSHLPYCMAFEKVTPPAAAAFDSIMGSNLVTPDGNTAIYSAEGQHADTQSLGSSAQYRAVRGEEGWLVKAIGPASALPGEGTSSTWFHSEFSADLSQGLNVSVNQKLEGIPALNRTVTRWSFDPLTPEVISRRANLRPTMEGIDRAIGFSADGKNMSFQGTDPIELAPDSVTPGRLDGATGHVYWHTPEEGTRLASLDPDGESLNGRCNPGSCLGGSGNMLHYLARDGSRMLIQITPDARPDSQELYLIDRDLESSVWVSEADGVAQPTSTNAVVIGGSEDLSRVYFTAQRLLPGAISNQSIYMYDADEGELTLVATGMASGDNLSSITVRMIGVAGSDAETMYFRTALALTPEAEGIAGNKAYGWRKGEGLRYLGKSSDGSAENGDDFEAGADSNVLNKFLQGGVSADGRYAVYRAGVDPTAYDFGGTEQVVRYDWDRDELICVSCDPRGNAATGSARLVLSHQSTGAGAGIPPRYGAESRPRVFDDGRVVFSTAHSLTPRDRNSVSDVYIWDGRPLLVSGGTAQSNGAWVEAVTPDIGTLFIYTRDQLVGADVDSSFDLYAVRVNGGFAAQKLPPRDAVDGCKGAACQGAPTPAPEYRDPDSLDPRGGGNASAEVDQKALRLRVARRAAGKGRALRIRVQVNAPGRLVVNGPGLRSTRKRAAKAGRVNVTLRLRPAALRQLQRAGRYRTSARIRFLARDGRSQMRRVKVIYRSATGSKSGVEG